MRVDSLEQIIQSEKWENFLAVKPNLPEQCKSCEFLKICHGGCPRNRVQNF
ncbi:SPASM domain-containing protein [Ornithinibacillus caprae]|uniref:SPASM domain-containing protein n=1 Tax=Ornithinibacillus caprae TaxID=2678566 RepID=UPI003CCD108F